MQVPFGSGVVPGGQHMPQEVICEGSQHAPSVVIPLVGSEQGVTQLPLMRVCPFGQGTPVNGIGQGLASGLVVVLTGGTATKPVFWQMQTSAPGPVFAAGADPLGH